MSTALSPQKLFQHSNCAGSPHRARRNLFQNGRVPCLTGLAASQRTPAHKPDAAEVSSAASNVSINSEVAGSTEVTSSSDGATSSGSTNTRHAIAAVLAAGMALSTSLAAAPVAAFTSAAAATSEVELQQSSAGPLHPSSVAALPMPEAPALVSDSSDVLLGSMREAVAGGLQEMAASSMTAVGGPVVGEALAAGLANHSSSSSSLDAMTINSITGSSISSTAAAVPADMNPGPASAAVPAAAEPASSNSSGHHALLCSLWQRYCNALETSPLLTKVYTGVVGTMLGDLAAQLLSYSQQSSATPSSSSSISSRDSSRSSKGRSTNTTSKPGFKFDVLRCGRLCLYSAAIGTPMGHYWYEVLEALVMPGSPTAPAAVAAKVALDQLLQTPFGMALFFAVMKAMEGRPREVPQELRTKLMPGLLANWKLWPAAQLVNFTVIPPEQRILFGNIVGVCWTCVISNMQQSSSTAAEAAGADRSSQSAAAAATSGTAAAGAVDARTLRRTSTPMPA